MDGFYENRQPLKSYPLSLNLVKHLKMDKINNMVISVNSQLGLKMNSLQGQVSFLELLQSLYKKEAERLDNLYNKLQDTDHDGDNFVISSDDPLFGEAMEFKNQIEANHNEKEVREKVTLAIGDKNIVSGDESKYFFICDSVYKAAELIKVTQTFTGRTLKDINFGKYTYLMGKTHAVRFVVGVNAIKGFYYDDKDNIAFEWGIEMDEGGYYFDLRFQERFTTIMQILTFVELGDIEIKMLEAGRNNGKEKNKGKVTNTSNNTVYVVDSSWNQIIIHTDGFAVRGHFRLQPCGIGMKDRHLIWIDAFEKHGYKRRPKAEIIN